MVVLLCFICCVGVGLGGVCVRGGCIFSAGATVSGCFGYGGGSVADRGFWGMVEGIGEFCSADQYWS